MWLQKVISNLIFNYQKKSRWDQSDLDVNRDALYKTFGRRSAEDLPMNFELGEETFFL